MNEYSNVLLTSENYIKSQSNISDNMAGKYLLPAVKIVQDIRLKEIIGECLMRYLQELVATKEIDNEDNVWYKTLLNDYVKPYITNQTLVEIVDIVANKITNAGLVQVTDEHIQQTYTSDRNNLKEHYQRIADSYKRMLREFLYKYRSNFPEMDTCTCEHLASLMQSDYTGGLFLGGARGRTLRIRKDLRRIR